jgi:hypothetical protein
MGPEELGVLIPIIVPTAMFAMIFGIVYLYKRERMAMIERGMDPRRYKPVIAPYQTLKWGLLLAGAGLGLLISVILISTCFKDMDDDVKPGLFFGLIALCGGLGLIVSFRMEKKGREEELTKNID